jgi:Leucine-rich repeat (LRR) protein
MIISLNAHNISDPNDILEHYSPNNSNHIQLHLHGNRIETFPTAFFRNFFNVTHLDLSSNKISELSWLDGLQSLVVLNLTNNYITNLLGIENLKRLRRLNVSFNDVSSLKPFSLMYGQSYSLESLDISGNDIKDFQEFYYLIGIVNLKVLYVDAPYLPDADKVKRNPICIYQKISFRDILPNLELIDLRDKDNHFVNYGNMKSLKLIKWNLLIYPFWS